MQGIGIPRHHGAAALRDTAVHTVLLMSYHSRPPSHALLIMMGGSAFNNSGHLANNGIKRPRSIRVDKPSIFRDLILAEETGGSTQRRATRHTLQTWSEGNPCRLKKQPARELRLILPGMLQTMQRRANTRLVHTMIACRFFKN